ncbi:right-handed parallel beta-helix repeat-containing protein [Luethyella okanaganae]|uniref:Right-handed parallel beta-helix repeat-containing protein n=1 Tax=Luethyella okanaganae TaxID=69372 RepID=A0ABW1VFI0_9MICO
MKPTGRSARSARSLRSLTAIVASSFLALAGVSLSAVPAAAATPTVIIVSPGGDDAAAGTAAAPIATLVEARQRVRTALEAGETPVTVELGDGQYSIDQTVLLDERDSGTPGAPVVWKAADGAQPILSGGRTLTPSWSTHAGQILVADVPVGIDTDQLFVNGQRQILARYPNYQPGQKLGGYAPDAIAPARVATWSNPTTGQVRAMHLNDWGGNSYRITGVSNGNAVLEWVGDNQRGDQPHVTYRMVENIFEELDSPGEWFHDKAANKLYYWPAAGVDVNTASFRTAEIPELIRVQGADSSSPAHDIQFLGLTFTQTHRTLFTGTFEPISLSDWAIVRQGSVVMKNTQRVDIRSSRFTEVGGNAVFIDGYAQGNVVDHNVFFRSGASDVAVVGCGCAVRDYSTWGHEVRTITDTTPGPKTEDYPRELTVSNNLMSEMGRFEKQTAGVEVSIASRIRVLNNTIHDGPRAGINIGDGTWGGHLISGNDLYNLVTETGDHGPINSWGRDRFWPASGLSAEQRKAYAFLDAVEPTTIDHNRIWHNREWAIDLDDGSGNYVLSNNLLLNAGIKLREGYRRIVSNNILVDGGVHSHVSYTANEDRVVKNVTFARTPYYFIQADPAFSGIFYDDNTFFNDGLAVSVVDAAWRAAGHDVHSVIANPRAPQSPWQHPGMLDYTLAADSPALGLGFVNFPMDTFGKPGVPAATPPVTWETAAEGGTRDSWIEPWLGAETSGIYSAALASSVGLSESAGYYLKTVPAGSAAAAAGLTAGDVIQSINGVVITDKNSFWKEWNSMHGGVTVSLGVWRNQALVSVALVRPTGVEKINNTSGVVYSGSGWDWKNDKRGGAKSYLNDIDATQGQGSSFTLSFWGTGLTMSTQTNSDEAVIELSVDGGAWQRVDLRTPTRIFQSQVFNTGTLADGAHTVVGRSTNTGYFLVDSFEITRVQTPPTIALGTESVQSGDPVSVSLRDGVVNGEYALELVSDIGAIPLGSVTAGIDGTARAEVVVPDGTAAGTYTLRATFGELTATAPLTVTEPPTNPMIVFDVLAKGRCVAGRAFVAVTVTNGESVPIRVSVLTPYGSKSFPKVVAGKKAFHFFASRLVDLPAGSVTVWASGVIDGEKVSVSRDVSFDAVNCAG